MQIRRHRTTVSLAAMVCAAWVTSIGAQQRAQGSGATPPPPTREVPGLEEFTSRVKDYAALHKKLEDALPKLPDDATPQQIDRNQRTLGAQIAAARTTAKPGQIFTPAIQGYVRRVLANVFKGPAGKQLRSSIMDENPPHPPLRVNARYPDTVPLSTMPPEVLEALPKLPEGLEYRFVDDALILLDGGAHLIVDFVTHALPATA
jgi:hypothetical protein